ncbi:hypothetical protein, partial [Pseudomonas veronii]|uniref:hypothetical protein n=2 Tax=Pseudomonas veronii TaxID=76761 RepID=UPI0039FC021B
LSFQALRLFYEFRLQIKDRPLPGNPRNTQHIYKKVHMKLSYTVTALTVLATLVVGLTGCQVIKPTENDLKSRAQNTIGKPITNISNVRSDFNTTYFTAKTSTGEYACELPSGPGVALGSMGMGLGAQCTKQ